MENTEIPEQELNVGHEVELQQAQQELEEIVLLLEQSQAEVDKLTQRNTAISTHLQQVQTQIEELPPAEVRRAYDAALEAQQRLMVMSGQIEKLQSERQHIERYLGVLQLLQGPEQAGQGDGQGISASIEALIHAQESERQRLSRQMHDGPAQALSNFVLQAEIAMRLFEVDPEKARQELEDLKKDASETFQKMREFISDLRPITLDELGLIPAIERYAANYAQKAGLKIVVSAGGSDRSLGLHFDVLVFRTVQELISADSLHEQASSINVQLDVEDRAVSIAVEDDGRGFDPIDLPDGPALLVKSISERVEMLGGTFDAKGSPESGSVFSVWIPLVSV